jgi:hypothetical protein
MSRGKGDEKRREGERLVDETGQGESRLSQLYLGECDSLRVYFL